MGPAGEQLIEDGTKYDEQRAEQAASTGTSAEPGVPSLPSGPTKPVEAPAAGNVPLHGQDGQLDLTPPAKLTVTGQLVPQTTSPPAVDPTTAGPENAAPTD